MVMLTAANIGAALTEIIAELGRDYVYRNDATLVSTQGSTCRYADVPQEDGTRRGANLEDAVDDTAIVGSCIVGRIIEKVDPAELRHIVKSGRNFGASITALLDYGLVEIEEPNLRYALSSMQNAQDNGATYGYVHDLFTGSAL